MAKKRQFIWSGIEWDTDGVSAEELGLPTSFVMEVEDDNVSPDDFDVASILSDEYDYAINSMGSVDIVNCE
jgi:hypothetical protein